jgi:DNA-binding NarL/FixJ family response regulator
MITPRRPKVVPPPPTRNVGRLKKITVLLAEDNALLRSSLCSLLEAEGQIKVIGQARNGREAVRMEKNLRPDVILMDISMPVLNGLDATRQILTANPAAKIIILSGRSDDAYVECMVRVGVVGFLEKLTAAGILTKAIHEVCNGHRYFSPAISKRMAVGKNWSRNDDGLLKPNGVLLTVRETKVLQLVAEGQVNKQVAATLGISIKTVEKHRLNAKDKLNTHETADLIRYAS